MTEAHENALTVMRMEYILSMITVATNRKFDDDAVTMWHDLLRDLPYDDTHEAVKTLLRESTDFLSPAGVRRMVLRLRRGRINKGVDAVPAPSGLSGAEYLDWYRRRRAEAARAPRAPRPPQERRETPRGLTGGAGAQRPSLGR